MTFIVQSSFKMVDQTFTPISRAEKTRIDSRINNILTSGFIHRHAGERQHPLDKRFFDKTSLVTPAAISFAWIPDNRWRGFRDDGLK
jgi:hypothetical protein